MNIFKYIISSFAILKDIQETDDYWDRDIDRKRWHRKCDRRRKVTKLSQKNAIYNGKRKEVIE